MHRTLWSSYALSSTSLPEVPASWRSDSLCCSSKVMSEALFSRRKEERWCSLRRERLATSGCIGVLFSHGNMRIKDNYALTAAVLAAKTRQQPIVGVFVVDGRFYAQPSSVGGFFRKSTLRARFDLESLRCLRKELEKHGVPLLIRTGFPEFIIPELCNTLFIRELHASTQTAPHEQLIEASVRTQLNKNSIELKTVWDSTLVHLDDLASPVSMLQESLSWFLDDLPVARVRPTLPYNCDDGRLQRLNDELIALLPGAKVSAKRLPGFSMDSLEDSIQGPVSPLPLELFASAAELEGCQPSDIRGQIPSLSELGYGESDTFADVTCYSPPTIAHDGGEESGLLRLSEWLQGGGLREYNEFGRSGALPTKMWRGAGARISPWIANGCLSVRTVYEHLRTQAHTDSSTGLAAARFHEGISRLGRRDFWHFMGLRYGRSLFFPYGPRPEQTGDIAEWRCDEKIIRRWCSGLTGIPFCDAAMRELVSTGYVAAEGRRALAWLLTRGYGQDWRVGAEWFERCSLDYDPFVCYGNFAYHSELIRDDFGEKVFSAPYIAHKVDQTGLYIRRWLPELSRVPTRYIHRPHVLTSRMQQIHQVTIGKTYPFPLKLWDGAQQTLGPDKLTSYFASLEQLEGTGYGEAKRLGTCLVPEDHTPLKYLSS